MIIHNVQFIKNTEDGFKRDKSSLLLQNRVASVAPTKQTAIGTVQGKPDKFLRKKQPNENRTRWTFEACEDKKPTLGRYVSNKESQLRK